MVGLSYIKQTLRVGRKNKIFLPPLNLTVIPDKGAQRPLIRYPAQLSKGIAFCLYILKTKNKTLRVLALALDPSSALTAFAGLG